MMKRHHIGSDSKSQFFDMNNVTPYKVEMLRNMSKLHKRVGQIYDLKFEDRKNKKRKKP
eukprot:CAMPEP_0170564644 /NCGR_PEP_ID=MMETSP0211-20121228/74069_1 /TAXON_ID=311385 /ORGANISM="Pseudokeronopsis sp., Strain OXSARD2" /LENGTH=58 /DNA_ID=CAMNT_0010884373 /DNA_START=6 /DNA_END=178 /DNA_ORIENTATION=-